MTFAGWSKQDAGIFDVPDFHERMARIRSEITPKLEILAKHLEPFLGDTPFFAHVARHLRRRTNAPDETWVAFSRDKRAYKKYAHLLTGIGDDGAFARLVVKADGIDIVNLRNASARNTTIKRITETMRDESAKSGYKIELFDGMTWTLPTVQAIAAVCDDKNQDFMVGRQFSPTDANDGPAYVRKVADTFQTLMAFYKLSAGLAR